MKVRRIVTSMLVLLACPAVAEPAAAAWAKPLGAARDAGAEPCDEGGGGGSSVSYAVAPRVRSAAFPVRLSNALNTEQDLGTLAFFRTRPAFGLVIHEFVASGWVGACAGGILAGGGSRAVRDSGGQVRWIASDAGTKTGAAHLSIEAGPDHVHGEVIGWFEKWAGYRIGLGVVGGLELEPAGKLGLYSPTRRMLETNGYLAATAGRLAGDVNMLFRAGAPLGGLGGVEALLDVPVMDALLGGLLAIGVLPGQLAGWVYGFGRPRVTVAAYQTFGPVWLRASAVVPTEFIVVPWYFLDTTLGLEVGIAL